MTWYDPADYTTEIAEKIFELTNAERVAVGLNEVSAVPELTAAAQLWASEQPLSYGHVRPDGRLYYTAFSECRYPWSGWSGENCAGWPLDNTVEFNCHTTNYWTDKDKMVDHFAEMLFNCWMNAWSHRCNMLDATWKYMGVGVYVSVEDGHIYAVQDFAA